MKRRSRFKYRVVTRVTKTAFGDPLDKPYWREWSRHHTLEAAEKEAQSEAPADVKIEEIT